MYIRRLFIAFLVLSGVVEKDLSAQEINLTLTPGFGFAGSKGNSVLIAFENENDHQYIAGFEIHMHWDPNVLSICDEDSFDCLQCGLCCVCGQPPVSQWNFFAYSTSAEAGSLVVVTLTQGDIFERGKRPIIDIKFDVAENAGIGMYDMDFGKTLIYTLLGPEIYSPIDGEFSVIRKGDVNNDEDVNVLDVVFVVRIILGEYQPTPGELSMADCLDDSQIDAQDALCIVQIILGH